VNSVNDLRIDYIEFSATDIAATQRFYSELFGWKFEDYGPEYTSFHDGRLAGGFRKAEVATAAGQPLIVLYAVDLEAMESKVKAAGGAIVKETFSFPGGRRFHFRDPSGNELAIWSDRPPAR
jgi:predicted enzyme related to lactoylglutathione lyase